MKICNVHIGLKYVDVEGKVVEKSDTMEGYTRYGSVFRLAYATISDGTGSIKLNLWNQQMLGIAVGDTLHIEQASITQHKGVKQLGVGKRRGTIFVVKSDTRRKDLLKERLKL
jgi:replication factor A1